MQWDYGNKARGPSMEKTYFFENLRGLAAKVEPFWYDEYLGAPGELGAALLRKAGDFKPDLIFFLPAGEEFQPAVLDELKGKWPTLAWFGDDTWRFDLYAAKMAPHFTYAATTDPFSVTKYEKLGITPILTQWAAQLSGPPPAKLPPEAYDRDVSFVGGYNSSRAWYIERIRAAGIAVDCFGAGWPAGKISFPEMEKIFYRSRINLNLSNSVNPDVRYLLSGIRPLVNFLRSPKLAEQIKARNFEIPLAGGFQLTNYVRGIERYLSIGGEVAVFASPEECVEQVRYYLQNEDERREILLAGHRRALAEHTYEFRLKNILGEIWK